LNKIDAKSTPPRKAYEEYDAQFTLFGDDSRLDFSPPLPLTNTRCRRTVGQTQAQKTRPKIITERTTKSTEGHCGNSSPEAKDLSRNPKGQVAIIC
jgi:hypothetical protein